MYMEHDIQLRWTTLEYPYKEHPRDWYVAVIIIIVSLMVMSFLLDNILFGIFIALGGFTLLLYAVRKPGVLEVAITDKGVVTNNTLYLFSEISSFWVEEGSNEPKIILESKKTYIPYIIIPLGDADPDEVRSVLGKSLKETEHVEPITQKLMEHLGF